MNKITNYRRNFYAFIWHALFLAFAQTFIDVNTVLSSFVLNLGGSSLHIGILTGISIGLPMVTQLLFAGFLAGRTRKKPLLLMGIYLRVLSLIGMGYTLSISASSQSSRLLLMIFMWIGVFSISGAFAGISYTDIMGKVFIGSQRKKFLVFKEFISAIGMLLSAIAAHHMVIAFPYPENYTVIFFTASGLLFTAAFGFLMIKEDSTETAGLYRKIRLIMDMPRFLKSDMNLINYILLVNFSSLGLILIPFYVALSKSLFGLSQNQVGNFILLQFVGMIVSTFIWNWVAKHFKFKGIACGYIIIGSLLPIMALFFARYGIRIYQWIFFIAGFSIPAYKIFLQGILLEITNNENRAIYAGISGALSLTTAIFPLLAGILINAYGFAGIFIIISPLVIVSIYFLFRIKCNSNT